MDWKRNDMDLGRRDRALHAKIGKMIYYDSRVGQ